MENNQCLSVTQNPENLILSQFHKLGFWREFYFTCMGRVVGWVGNAEALKSQQWRALTTASHARLRVTGGQAGLGLWAWQCLTGPACSEEREGPLPGSPSDAAIRSVQPPGHENCRGQEQVQSGECAQLGTEPCGTRIFKNWHYPKKISLWH